MKKFRKLSLLATLLAAAGALLGLAATSLFAQRDKGEAEAPAGPDEPLDRIRTMRAYYYACVEALDAQVAAILDDLRNDDIVAAPTFNPTASAIYRSPVDAATARPYRWADPSGSKEPQ
jgi:hypothetical protein